MRQAAVRFGGSPRDTARASQGGVMVAMSIVVAIDVPAAPNGRQPESGEEAQRGGWLSQCTRGRRQHHLREPSSDVGAGVQAVPPPPVWGGPTGVMCGVDGPPGGLFGGLVDGFPTISKDLVNGPPDSQGRDAR